MPKLSKSDQVAKISGTEARRRRDVALAEIRELEAAEKASRLVPVDQVQDAWSMILGKVRTAVMRIPDKCAPGVAGKKPAEVRTILLTEVQMILQNLANDIQRLSESGDTQRSKRTHATSTPTVSRMGRRKLSAK